MGVGSGVGKENNGLFVQLGLGFKLNTKIGLHNQPPPSPHKFFEEF